MQLTAIGRESSSAPARLVSGWLTLAWAVALAASISIWLITIRAPLWLDETGTYWQISAGFSQIWPRQFLCFPAYNYILWLSTRILGTSELALRTPSILAMLGAVYLLYRAARELFSRELSLLAAIIFCLHPIVFFESIDVRPYAFAVLAVCAAIFALLRLRNNNSSWRTFLFGLLAALPVYFHYLFAVILPAFAICFFLVKTGTRRLVWRQFGIATAALALAFLPLIPGLRYLFHTSASHVYEAAPQFHDLFFTFAPGWMPLTFGGAMILAGVLVALRRPRESQAEPKGWVIWFCASLALVPLLILYGVSAGTSIHMFTPRHRLVAVPGIALCWALLAERYLTRVTRPLFAIAIVATTAYLYLTNPAARTHNYSWKYALQVAQTNAAADNAPVLMCSDYPEADFSPMPLDSPEDSPKTSRFFTPLSYYKLSVPVIPLPRALNDQAMRIGSQFLNDATVKHQRFLALASQPSYKTLDWLSQQASADYNVQTLGTFDAVKVLQFTPRAHAPASTP